jgi:hypothetical protein
MDENSQSYSAMEAGQLFAVSLPVKIETLSRRRGCVAGRSFCDVRTMTVPCPERFMGPSGWIHAKPVQIRVGNDFPNAVAIIR